MPKNYNEPGSANQGFRAEPPEAHSPGGGDYQFLTSGGGSSPGGGGYDNQRGSQGEPGGGGYSWSKTSGGHDPGGGSYSWSKAEGGQSPMGDVQMPANAPMGYMDQPDPGRSIDTKPDPYNPVQNGMI